MSKLGLSTRRKEKNAATEDDARAVSTYTIMGALHDAQAVVIQLRAVNDTATALESMILFPLIADAQALVYNINDFIAARNKS